MITWSKIILILLQLAYNLFRYAQENKLIEQGKDEEIARQAAEMLRMTNAAKKISEEIFKMDEKQVDDLLKSFEPK